MIGIYLSPSGDHSAQIKAMRHITETWADRIRVRFLQRGEVWAALQTTIAKHIEYPLQALTLSPKECKHILAPVIKVRIPKAGIPASIPMALRHAPVGDFRFGIVDPYISQGCSWIHSIVDHILQFPNHMSQSILGGKFPKKNAF